MTNTEMAYFNAAKAVSKLSDYRFHLGAVVVNHHRIIGSGFNSATRTDIIQARLDQKKYGCFCEGRLHAESSALIPFIKRRINLSGASIYVYRELKDGTPAMARPCSSCFELIKKCGIKKVYYTTNNGFCREDINGKT